MPSPDDDGWVERTSNVAGYVTRWLERTALDEPGTTEQFFPLDRQRALPSRVLLTSRARETISHTAAWQSGVDRLETGGWLIGDGRDCGAIVTAATRPGPGAHRSHDALTLDYSGLERFALRALWDDPFSVRIGQWHTHPGGPAEPSETDLAGWHAGLSVINRQSPPQPYYVGIIATDRPRPGWHLHAWVVRHGINGDPIVEPAAIEPFELPQEPADNRPVTQSGAGRR